MNKDRVININGKKVSFTTFLDFLEDRSLEETKWSIEDSNNYAKYLKSLFDSAEKTIKERIASYMIDISDNTNLSIDDIKRNLLKDEMKDFKMTLKEYIKKSKSKLTAELDRELTVASKLHEISVEKALYHEMQAVISDLFIQHTDSSITNLVKVYNHAYENSDFIAGINTRKIEFMMKKAYLPTGTYSNALMTSEQKMIQRVYQEVIKRSISGSSKKEVIATLSKEFNSSYNGTLAIYDTVHSFSTTEARFNSYQDANIDKYQIMSVMDSKTTEVCRDMNLKIFRIKDKLNWVTYPPFHYRCRTSTRPYFDDDIQKRIEERMKENSKQMLLDREKEKAEWRKNNKT